MAVSHITAVATNIQTACQYAPPFAVIRLLAYERGQMTSAFARPQMGRKAGYTGKVVYSPRIDRFFAVEAENNHSVQVSDIVWLNDGWQVIGSRKWFRKSEIVVCK